jgi:MFS family permease
VTRPDRPAPTDLAQDSSDRWLTPGVFSVGAASFGSDAGHELTTSLLPSFLASTMHAGPATLGAIEGVSDALTGLAKLAGGPLSADPTRRARLASGGYLVTAIATGAIGLATAPWQAALLRGTAWLSRGVRTPARDSLLVSLVPRRAYGRAAGVERAGDNLGALAGPLLASLLVTVMSVRHAMLFAAVPGVLAAASITIAAKEARRTLTAPPAKVRLTLNLRQLRSAGMARALAPAALFEFGNVATTLLILRSTGLLHTGTRTMTHATSLAILMYAAHNAVAAVSSLVAGSIVDRWNARGVLALGAGTYVAAYGLFALGPQRWGLVLCAFLLAGIGIGFAETAESATVALALPDRLRGNGYGVLGLVQAVGDLVATLVAGILWSVFSGGVAFLYVTAWMLASAVTALMTQEKP